MSTATINAIMASTLKVVETFPDANPADNTSTFNPYDESVTLTGSSSPAASVFSNFSQALTGGAATIDLTALPDKNGGTTTTGNGLKIQFVKFSNPSANANKISIGKGASNGIQLDGATTWSVVLAPGQSFLMNCDGASDTIGSTKKTIDLAGTGAQTLNVMVVMG